MQPGKADAMCDEWMPTREYPLTVQQYDELPRNPAYKYEYHEGRAVVSPRPRHYHARLQLQPAGDAPEAVGAAAGATIRQVRLEDWPALEPLFVAAFRRVQPFGGLDEETLFQAARKCLDRARRGGDGPWIEAASFVAERAGQLAGAIVVTLLPLGDPCDWDSYYWREPPPEDALGRRLGRPHLTWIFVTPEATGHGLGTRLLHRAADALFQMGYAELLSTFLLGNDSSLLWHWRSGFELLAHPGSVRSMHDRWRRHATH